MRAVRFHEFGGPDVLRVESIETPPVERDELLVDVRAAGINPVDTYFREGTYEPASLPMVPGSDVAGVVRAVGDDVSDFEPGDRVFGTALGPDHQGSCSDFVAVPTDRVATLPEPVDFETGGAAGIVAATAWRALVDHADLTAADTCLVHGGSGGVGHVAVQLAAAGGGTVITTAAPEHHSRLESLGADVVLDYDHADLEGAIDDAAPDGVDVVLTHRIDEYLQLDANVAAPHADIVGIGQTQPTATFTDIASVRGKDLHYHFMSLFNAPDISAILERLARLFADGTIEIEIDRRYDLEGVPEGHRAVMSESFFGKLVVVPDGEEAP